MIWLLSPYTKGSSVLYRKFVHPTLSNKEKVCSHSASPPAQAKAALCLQPRTFLALPESEVTWQGPGLLQQAVPCPGVNESRAGPGQGSLPSPLPCSPLTPQEIDEYITQARDKSYETMMRVGKRGLNLAANAAVTAAAKVRWGPSVHLGPLVRSCFHPVLGAGKVWGLCS